MTAHLKGRLGLSLVGVLALVIATASPAPASAGNLDTSFDGDGKVTTDFPSPDDASAVAIQADGKIVAAGRTVVSEGNYSHFALARYHPNGTLDTTFDGDGKVTTDFGGFGASARAVAIQADGKIVAAGVSLGRFALARYNVDGSLDPTFDGDGKVTTEFDTTTVDNANAVAIQGDGKIVAAGAAFDPVISASMDFALVRYNADGSLDPTFGGDGKVMTDFGGQVVGLFDEANGVAIQGDGKIVAAGSSFQPTSEDFALARYNTDGSLDLGFGVVGKVTTDFAREDDEAHAVTIQEDMKIVAAGEASFTSLLTSADFALARYNTDGSLDPTFGGDGKVTTDLAGDTDHIYGAAIQGGKIVAAGLAVVSGDDDFALARYSTNGSLDPTFGGDGKVVTDFGGKDQASDMTIQGDGRIVAAGSASGDFALARYSTDGSLDPTFGGDGKITTDFGAFNQASDVAIQGDGKIVAAGLTSPFGRDDFALARYNTDGSLDPTFDGDGKVSTDFGGDGHSARAVAIQGDGKIVAAGSGDVAFGVPGSDDFALARYNVDGSLDPTFGGDGKVTTDFAGGDDVADGMAIQGDGKIVAAGFSSGDFALARYNTDGSLDPTFGGDGKVTTFFGGFSDYAFNVAIQVDGKLVAAGHAGKAGGYVDFALARYNTDGSLDPTFDGDGKVTTDFGDYDQPRAVAIQADGKIVAAGYTSVDFAVARYNTDGSLDPTFDGDGKVTTDFGGGANKAYGMAIQGDGKIVVAGYAYVPGYDFALARYNADGSLDPAFGGDGKVTTDVAGATDVAAGVAIQADGRIVAAGYAWVSGDYDFAVARYRLDSEADLSITKTGPPGRVPTGRDMTYTLTVTNNGPDSASGVTVTDQLPSTVTFVSTTSTQGSCGESNGTVSCTLGEMSSGAVVTIEIVVTPTTAGRITNSALVASPTPDSVQANNTDSEDTSICRITSRRSSIPCG